MYRSFHVTATLESVVSRYFFLRLPVNLVIVICFQCRRDYFKLTFIILQNRQVYVQLSCYHRNDYPLPFRNTITYKAWRLSSIAPETTHSYKPQLHTLTSPYQISWFSYKTVDTIIDEPHLSTWQELGPRLCRRLQWNKTETAVNLTWLCDSQIPYRLSDMSPGERRPDPLSPNQITILL